MKKRPPLKNEKKYLDIKYNFLYFYWQFGYNEPLNTKKVFNRSMKSIHIQASSDYPAIMELCRCRIIKYAS